MLKNIASNWTYIALSAISVFVLYPFCLRVLGAEQYGLWLLLSSVTAYFSLMQLGVPMANVKFVSKYIADDDFVKLSEVVSTNFLFFSIVGFSVVLFGLIISSFIDRLFNVNALFVSDARWATILLAVNVGLGFSFEVFEGALHGMQRFVFLNLLKNVLLVIRVACVFVFLTRDHGLYILSYVLIGVTSLQALASYLFLRLKFPGVVFSLRHVNRDVFRTVFSFGLFVMVLQLSMRISFNTDSIVIGYVVSVESIVLFAAGGNIVNYLLQFVSGVSTVLMPNVSGLVATGEWEKVRSLFTGSCYGISLVVVPVCLALILLGGDFIALWLGEQFREVSGNVLVILTVSYLFFLVQWGVVYPLLLGSSYVKFPTILMASTAILNIVLSLMLGSEFGLYGVAFGTALPNLINSIIVSIYSCRVFSVKFTSFLFKSIAIPYSAGFFFALPCIFVRHIMTVDSYGALVVSVLIPLCCYVFAVYSWYLDDHSRSIVRAFFLRYV